jgi:hypothetical protein
MAEDCDYALLISLRIEKACSRCLVVASVKAGLHAADGLRSEAMAVFFIGHEWSSLSMCQTYGWERSFWEGAEVAAGSLEWQLMLDTVLYSAARQA